MNRKILVLGLSATLVAAAAFAPYQASAQKGTKTAPPLPTFEKDVAPVVNKFCTPCHATKDAPGGVILPKTLTATGALKRASLWSKVAKNTSNGHMPPEGMPQPTKAQRAALVKWVDGAFVQDCDLADPGRVTIRRLNRSEYNHTVQDLLGTDLSPADDFPSDDVGYGFDNIGDVLTVSPLLMEKYLGAAERLSRAAIRIPRAKTREIKGVDFQTTGGADSREGTAFFFSAGTASSTFEVEHEGMYSVRFRLAQQGAGGEPSRAETTLDGTPLAVFDVTQSPEAPGWFELPLKLTKGEHKVEVKFTNDFYRPAADGQPQQDRNMIFHTFQAVGPKEGPLNLPKIHAWLLPKGVVGDQEALAKASLAKFAGRAFRRPATPTETDRLLAIYRLARKAGEPFERGLQLGVQATLSSPSFLFRVELDPAPTAKKAKRMLGGYELASRLSYFLWSSMPDERLLTLAAKGELVKPAVIEAETLRMLKDPKAARLTENFASQWLQLRKLNEFAPDKAQFPDFDEGLRADMIAETKTFFNFVRSADRSILDFIDGKYTFLNARLAKLYGLPAVAGAELRKVAVTDPRRGGVLTQAAVLAVNSNPTRTSPTKRGKWILEQILGSPPPPPPPGVGQLKDDKQFTDAMTIRQRMAEHRKDPACAQCHKRMDTLGFGFENYDAIGRWRTVDGKFPVDASGTLPGGKSFDTPGELKTILMGQKGEFAYAFGEKLLTFALGRGIEDADKCHLDTIAQAGSTGGYKFSALVVAVVKSDPFRKSRAGGTPP